MNIFIVVVTAGLPGAISDNRAQQECFKGPNGDEAIGLHKEKEMKNRTLKQCVSVGVLTVALICASTVSVVAAEFVSVLKDGVNLRSGPETKYEVLFQLPKGYPLKVLARKGKWLKVSDYENDRGWIYSPLVSKTRYVIVKVKDGNVRSGPGTKYDRVGKVARDVILKSIERKGDWIKVSHPQLTGWVHKQLVWP